MNINFSEILKISNCFTNGALPHTLHIMQPMDARMWSKQHQPSYFRNGDISICIETFDCRIILKVTEKHFK